MLMCSLKIELKLFTSLSIYPNFTPDLMLVKMLIYPQKNRIKVIGIQNVHLLCGRYQKGIYDIFHLQLGLLLIFTLCNDIDIFPVWQESDINFVFYEYYGYSKCWHLVWKFTEKWLKLFRLHIRFVLVEILTFTMFKKDRILILRFIRVMGIQIVDHLRESYQKDRTTPSSYQTYI